MKELEFDFKLTNVGDVLCFANAGVKTFPLLLLILTVFVLVALQLPDVLVDGLC